MCLTENIPKIGHNYKIHIIVCGLPKKTKQPTMLVKVVTGDKEIIFFKIK